VYSTEQLPIAIAFETISVMFAFDNAQPLRLSCIVRVLTAAWVSHSH
jgi:hypothetical protein